MPELVVRPRLPQHPPAVRLVQERHEPPGHTAGRGQPDQTAPVTSAATPPRARVAVRSDVLRMVGQPLIRSDPPHVHGLRVLEPEQPELRRPLLPYRIGERARGPVP
ncbi:hypothetical protein ACIP4S_40025 [Streptomyces chartreusis]|uniref:hypothetical protein n=1 Tax=Streptomyces chartreusis TaxID=1969 RepID=UPI0037F123BB